VLNKKNNRIESLKRFLSCAQLGVDNDDDGRGAEVARLSIFAVFRLLMMMMVSAAHCSCGLVLQFTGNENRQ